jgi:hypothetical protein
MGTRIYWLVIRITLDSEPLFRRTVAYRQTTSDVPLGLVVLNCREVHLEWSDLSFRDSSRTFQLVEGRRALQLRGDPGVQDLLPGDSSPQFTIDGEESSAGSDQQLRDLQLVEGLRAQQLRGDPGLQDILPVDSAPEFTSDDQESSARSDRQLRDLQPGPIPDGESPQIGGPHVETYISYSASSTHTSELSTETTSSHSD